LAKAEFPGELGLRTKVSDGVSGAHGINDKACLTALSTGIPASTFGTIYVVPKAATLTARPPLQQARRGSRPSADPPFDVRTVAGRITACRMKKGIDKATAAKEVKITPQSWGDLESGRTKLPRADTLLNMRDKLGFDPDYVIRGRGMPLLPRFEELASEMALIAIFRELRPEVRKNLLTIAQGLRRAQGKGPSPNDPFEHDAPKSGDDD
jgi:transcriptional regulator with XRE-family HTH domain